MEANEKLILTIDFGTQSVRVSIFDKHGNTLAQEKEVYIRPNICKAPNQAEQDPKYFYECLCVACKRITEKNKDIIGNLAGITMDCFRDSAVLLDKDRNVIRPCILWFDQRRAECKKKLPAFHRFLFKLVGKTDAINLNRKRTVSNWIIENEPENWAKVDKYVQISTYFNYLLTGELKDSSSNYGGHYPLNYKKREFYEKPLKQLTAQIFSIDRHMCCDLVKEGEVIGYINEEASKETSLPVGLPLYACGSDKSCETLGLGIIDDKAGAISLGTAASIETTTIKYKESEPFLPGFPSCIPGYFNMDIQVYRGFWMINWFLKEFAGKENISDILAHENTPEELNSHLKDVPVGSDGLVLQPYWGPALSRPTAKGAVIGFSDATTQNHFYRAIVEGIGYALREGLEHFEKVLKHPIKELRISGGGSQSDEICQLYADLFNRPVRRTQTFETGSLGAAIAGFLAIKEYKSPEEAIAGMVKLGDPFLPDEKNAKTYNYLYKNVYLTLYKSLKDTYSAIREFNEHGAK